MQADKGPATRAVLSVTSPQAEFLFGKLGTHARIAGATLRLKDPFENDRFGRKVVVEAASRQVAASAISALLFQLCFHFKLVTSLSESRWNYIADKGVQQGPEPYKKMVKWARQGYFQPGDRVQHAGTSCWLPLWFLLVTDEKRPLHDGKPDDAGDTAMQDAEQLVADLNMQRDSGGALQARSGASMLLADFPELSEAAEAYAAPEPMDYELSPVRGSPTSTEGARLFVVVDTNVLMSHMSGLEKTFAGYSEAALEARRAALPASLRARPADKGASGASGAGQPVVEVLLVVPWIVLSELDVLKDGQRKQQAGAARHALHRLRVLTSERDTYVRLQPAAEHERAVHKMPLPGGGARQLRNDDMILQTALFYQATAVQDLRGVNQRSGCFLLSNDTGLAVRAQANSMRCFTAREFPRNSEELAQPAAPPQTQEQQQHQQQQHLDLTEQLRRLRMAAQQAAALQQQQQAQQAAHQHQQQQRAEAAAALQAQHAAAARQQAALLQQAAAEQDAALGHVAGAVGLSFEHVVMMVASAVDMPPPQLVAERQRALSGGPISGQLAQAMQLLGKLEADPQHTAALLLKTHQAEQQRAQRAQELQQASQPEAQHAQQVQQLQQLLLAAAQGDQQALAQLAASPQALALMHNQLNAAGAAGLGSSSSASSGSGGLPQAQTAGSGGGLPPAQRSGSGPLPDGGSRHSGSSAGSGSARELPSSRGFLPNQRPDGAPQPLEGQLARELVARQLAVAGVTPGELLGELCGIIEECMAPIVAYHRQQDLGDMWLVMLEGDQQPPWDACATLHIIHSHDSTFTWGVLDKGMVADVRKLERDLRGGGRSRPVRLETVLDAARFVLALLQQFHRTASTPRPDGDSPDPSIEGFVSLGQATQAVQQGIQRCMALLAQLTPAG